MTDINLPNRDLTPYFRRAHIERAKAAVDLARAAGRVIDGWVAAIAAACARRRLHRETVHELQALSDRTLQDIGIPRSAIWSVADDLVNAVTGTAVDDHRHPHRARPVPAARHHVAAKQSRGDRQHAGTHALAGCG